MPKKFTDEEYAKMLPKKQVGTAVLFFNAKGELLIVKPDYKEGWLVPGGSCEEYTFTSPDKAISILSPSLRRSVPDCLRAIDERKVVYLDSSESAVVNGISI
ncbi:MAG: hypothetical protein ACYCZZ_01290 [Minisyncoccota bacterium]